MIDRITAPRFIVRLTTVCWTIALIVMLTACTPATVRVGEPCETVGAESRTRQGAYVVCKAPTKTDPTAKARWRRA